MAPTAPRPKKIRISEAAAAIGTTYKAVRHWIDRYGESIEPTAPQSGGWIEFSWGDVGALAVTKYLVDFGVPAYKAFEISTAALQHRWPGLFDVDEPHWKFRDENDNFFIVGRDQHGNWFSSAVGGWEMSPGVYSDAMLTLQIESIVLVAFQRLNAMGYQIPIPDEALEAWGEDSTNNPRAKRRRAVRAAIHEVKMLAANLERAAHKLNEQTAAALAANDTDELRWLVPELQALKGKFIKVENKK